MKYKKKYVLLGGNYDVVYDENGMDVTGTLEDSEKKDILNKFNELIKHSISLHEMSNGDMILIIQNTSICYKKKEAYLFVKTEGNDCNIRQAKNDTLNKVVNATGNLGKAAYNVTKIAGKKTLDALNYAGNFIIMNEGGGTVGETLPNYIVIFDDQSKKGIDFKGKIIKFMPYNNKQTNKTYKMCPYGNPGQQTRKLPPSKIVKLDRRTRISR